MSTVRGFSIRASDARGRCLRLKILGAIHTLVGITNLGLMVGWPTVWQGVFAAVLILFGQWLIWGPGRETPTDPPTVPADPPIDSNDPPEHDVPPVPTQQRRRTAIDRMHWAANTGHYTDGGL